jgi:gliding motility-associated-like protein
LPSITLTQNAAICIGNSISLNANGGTIYQWSPAGSLDNAGINNPVATPSSTTTYTVVVTDQNTCVDSSNVTITVNPLPTALATGDSVACAGSSLTLTASGGVSYSWTPASTLNDPNIANPVASPLSPTVYTVTVTDVNGCSDDATISVSINAQPKASFTVTDGGLALVTCEGYAGNLNNTSTDALNYIWNFPNGTSSTEEEPQVQLNLAGNNAITLIAINNNCYDTTIVDFASTIVSQIYDHMPNVFTPNGDNINDCFIYGKTIDLDDCSDIEVYNRWGKKVFESSSSHPCWNGQKDGDGTDLSAGTYYIVVNIAGQTYHGAITLIR